MNIDELKQTIEQRAGVPASLLTGETAEEVIARTKAILAFKRELEPQRTKTAREQFADWYNATRGTEGPDPAGAALADIEEAARTEAGGYPRTKDGGETGARKAADPRPAREQFADWLEQKAAFNPRKDAGGWKR